MRQHQADAFKRITRLSRRPSRLIQEDEININGKHDDNRPISFYKTPTMPNKTSNAM